MQIGIVTMNSLISLYRQLLHIYVYFTNNYDNFSLMYVVTQLILYSDYNLSQHIFTQDKNYKQCSNQEDFKSFKNNLVLQWYKCVVKLLIFIKSVVICCHLFCSSILVVISVMIVYNVYDLVICKFTIFHDLNSLLYYDRALIRVFVLNNHFVLVIKCILQWLQIISPLMLNSVNSNIQLLYNLLFILYLVHCLTMCKAIFHFNKLSWLI